MEHLTNWSAFYGKHIEALELVRLNLYHGLALFASFVLFVLFVTKCMKTPDNLLPTDKESMQETEATKETASRKPPERFFIFWRLFVTLYILAFSWLFWISVVYTAKLKLFPTNVSSILASVLSFLPLLTLAITFKSLEARLIPTRAQRAQCVDGSVKRPPKVPGLLQIENKHKGCAALLFVIGFFGFVGLNGGLMSYAVVTVSALWEHPQVVQGQVIKKRTGDRASTHITLQVKRARFLTPSGLGPHVMLPKQSEFRVPRAIYKRVRYKETLTLVVSSDEGVILLP